MIRTRDFLYIRNYEPERWPAGDFRMVTNEGHYGDVDGSPTKGAANAKVTIVEFSDFQCPYCGRVGPTLARLLEEYPDDVRIVYKHLPLSFHKQALPAAKASMAAERVAR